MATGPSLGRSVLGGSVLGGSVGGQLTDRRSDRLEHAQAHGRLSTIVGAVFDREQMVWSGAAGAGAHVGSQYRIGSITKTFTAVLVLRARDAGLLDLDAPVGRFLGEVGYADATLRELLSHTSGMQSEPNGSWWERTAGRDFPALVASNDGTGRVAPAGEYYHYSNLGYGLLGEVLARVYDVPWRRLVHDHLLAPLGMRHTSYLPRPAARPGWSIDHFTGVRVHEPLTDTGAMAPAGQLWSTVGDLAIWARVLSGAEPALLADESLAEMSRPVMSGYGLGLRLPLHALGTLVGHTGSMPGFLAALFVHPVSGIGSVVLSNATTGMDPLAVALDLIDGDDADGGLAPVTSGEPASAGRLESWRPTLAVPPEVEGVPGLWFWGNSAHELRWHNERLEMRGLAGGGMRETFELRSGRLIGVHGYHRGEPLDVLRRPDGSVHHLECATFVYTNPAYDPTAPVPGGAPR